MQRELGNFEHAWTESDEFAPLTVLGILQIHGSIQPSHLKQALEILQQRHPLLRARIQAQPKGGYGFQFDDTPPIPLDIIQRQGDDHWQQYVEENLNRSIDKQRGPLVTCAYLQPSKSSESKAEIIFAFHHTAVDGDSGLNLFHELLGITAALETGESPPKMPALTVQAPVEQMLPAAYQGLRGVWSRFQFMKNQLTEEIRYRWSGRGCRRAPINDASRCKILVRLIEPQLTNQLVRCCRKKRITLNNALGTAMLQALYEQFYGNRTTRRATPMRHVIFSSLRPYLSPPLPHENLGCYISMSRLMLMVNQNPQFWDLAQQMNDRARIAAQRGDKYAAALMVRKMMHMTLKLKAFRMGSTALSYMGVVDLDEAYGSVRPRNLHTFVTNFSLGPEYAGIARLYKGKLVLDLLYLDTDMDRSTAQHIADRMLQIIEDATMAEG